MFRRRSARPLASGCKAPKGTVSLANWFDRPLELKRLLEAAGISMVSCSRDLDFFVRAGREAPAIFIDEGRDSPLFHLVNRAHARG